MASDAPGGLTLASFESTCLEVGDWIWGTAQGAFNEKATMSQIIVDAVIGMIPVVGDVTGVRDLLAVVIGLSMDPRKREDKTQWILLVVLALALVPVVGGVVKGVGRLLIKGMGEAAQLAGQAEKAAHLASAAKDIVAFLNRVGVGNAERWLIELHFAQYQKAVMQQLDELAKAVSTASNSALQHVGGWLPEPLVNGTQALAQGAENFRQLVPEYVPDGIKKLDEYLTELQKYIRSGGETTSQTIAHPALPGPSKVNRTAELVLLEGTGAKRTGRGGLAANSSKPHRAAEYYEKQPGYPDLLYATKDKSTKRWKYANIATYSGRIVNRELQAGERIFRVFGPATTTHSFPVQQSFAAGGRLGVPSFWGLNKVPHDAEAWRHGSAVLDEWNGNGFMMVGTLLEGTTVPACTGLIAEQKGTDLAMQFLRGGDKQAMLNVPKDIGELLNKAADDFEKGLLKDNPVTIWGISWEFKATGWTDVNGIHGYGSLPGPGAVTTKRLGEPVVAPKTPE